MYVDDETLRAFERKTRERLELIEAQVALISERLGIPFERPSTGIPVEVASLVREGKKIEAIKLYREMTGADLGSAREAVESV
jgi:ribosomal protein L7/L12